MTALHRYAILDTPAEVSFDDVVALAADLAETPIAAITLIDEGRAWFKARLGLDVSEAPRDVAFCSYAVLDPSSVLEVEDTRADPRFADNPLVTPEDGLRFYTGAPLVTADGHALGTLCVMGPESKRLRPAQVAALTRLSRTVMSHLEARRVSHALLSVTEILDEVRGLQRLDDLTAAVRHVLGLVVRVLDADGVVAFLSETPGSSSYVAFDGLARPADGGAHTREAVDATLLAGRFEAADETSGVSEAVRTGETRFRAAASLDRGLSREGVEAARAQSTLHVPMPGENGVLGVLAVWWTEPVSSLEPTVARVLEVLAHEAGAAFARVRTLETLTAAADTDALTGLANRRAALARLARMPARFGLAFVDLDHFKRLNDTLGHDAGDRALRRFSDALAAQVRSADLAARWGGEEFVVALPGAGVGDVLAVLARVRDALGAEGPFFSSGAVARLREEPLLEMLGNADRALYWAKADGRGVDRTA